VKASEYLGPLRERPFRLLWLGQSISGIGDALVYVALVFAVLEVGSTTDLGLVLGAFWLGRAVFMLIGGVWADRLPRRTVMLTSDLVRAGAQGSTAALLLSGVIRPWMFVLTQALWGAAAAFFGPASTGLIPQLTSGERLQQANALLGLSRSAINVLGPAIAGILVAAFGPGWVFAVDAVSFLASAAFLVVLRVPPHERPPQQAFIADLRRGWQEVVRRKWLRASILVFSVTNVALAALFVIGPVVAEDELGGAKAYGVITTGAALGGIAGGVIALRYKPERPLLFNFVFTLASALPLLLYIPPAPTLVIAAAMSVSVAGIASGNAIWEAQLQRHIPPDAISRVSSYDWLVSIVFMPLGMVVAGWLSGVVGVDATLAAAAAICVVANLSVLLISDVRNFRAAEPTPEREPAFGSEDGSRDQALPVQLP
jgi:MFS family permease